MNVNKKIGRFRQWAGERMGAEVKTDMSNDFKALEMETNLRQEGTEKIHKAMLNYTKAISKRAEGENREKQLPIAQLGMTMVQHGDEFEHDSQYGQCLTAFGHNQERLARSQEAYIVAATNTWLEGLERSLAQMKEYQAARKKLDSRRLGYDSSLAKMQKAKKEDFRVEEELRSQKLKFEEAEEDVYRRMLDIKDAEGDNAADLTALLDAQLQYHEKCREVLLLLKEDWPAGQSTFTVQARQRPVIRSRSNTARSMVSTHSSIDERSAQDVRIGGRPNRAPSNYLDTPIEREVRPGFTRSTTFDPTTRDRRDVSPIQLERLNRVPSDSLMVQRTRTNLRNVSRIDTNVFADGPSEKVDEYDRSYSPANSQGSGAATPLTMKKKPPPPPPPSRATKPVPPPPPAKRTLMT